MRRDVGKSFPRDDAEGSDSAELRLALGVFRLAVAAWQGSEDGLGQPLGHLQAMGRLAL